MMSLVFSSQSRDGGWGLDGGGGGGGGGGECRGESKTVVHNTDIF